MVERVQVDILGLSTSPASGGAYALILKELEGPRRLPIIIGAFEAQAIALEIEGIKPPRPMTHDLLKTTIETLGCSVTEVTITELRDGTFYANVAIDSTVNDEIDARPSDAIALAVRFRAPIYVSTEVLAEAGFIPEDDEAEVSSQDDEEQTSTTKERKLAELQKRLQDAIQREEYEIAAEIRDQLQKLLGEE